MHFADVQKLLDVLNRLVNLGNTVVVIEHNMDVIKNSDWLIDLGPEGGDEGGKIVATGTPQDVAKAPRKLHWKIFEKIIKKMTFDISKITIPTNPGIYLMKDSGWKNYLYWKSKESKKPSKVIFSKKPKLQDSKTCRKYFGY